MKKTVFTTLKIACILFAVLCCIFLVDCTVGLVGLFYNDLDNFFAEFEPEQDPKIAYAVEEGDIVVFNNETIRFAEKGHFELYVYACIYEDWVYFVDTPGEKAVILKKHVQTGETRTVFSAQAERLEYWKRPYYNASNNSIILYNKQIVYVFSVETETVVQYRAEEFVHSQTTAYTVTKLSDQELVVSDGATSRHITLSYMARRHEYAKRIQELPAHFWLTGVLVDAAWTEPTDRFFSDAYVLGDTVYLTCRVLDKDGQSNYVLFSYNYENDRFAYLFHWYTNDIGRVYPVPIVP